MSEIELECRNYTLHLHLHLKQLLMRSVLLLIITFLSLNLTAQTNIKVMFYNLLHYPSAPPFNRDEILKEILEGYQPDLFLVCELEDLDGANSVLDVSLNGIGKNYQKTPYTPNQSSNASVLEQLVYYNTAYFVLENQQVIVTTFRDINHYTFILKTADYLTNPIRLEVFVAHLKAQQGAANEQLRFEMATQFTVALDNLDPNSLVVFGGDFNVYSSTEPAYQKILDSNNNIVIKDVLNLNNGIQNWHNNVGWVGVHTQSTRASSGAFGNFGAGGGLDDRFDFIMLSENMLTGADIHYKPATYQSYGNNGVCFNDRIDGADCDGEFSQELRTNLYNMSDHFPVVLELETNGVISKANEITSEKHINLPHGNIVENELLITINEELINKRLTIYNLLGQTVLSKKTNGFEMVINTSFLEANIYFIQLEGCDEMLKFVKY